jgi:hypothetical protein
MKTNTEPFSLEEAAMIASSPEAKAHIASAPDHKTIGQLRAEVREMLRPAAIWRQLEKVRCDTIGPLGPHGSLVVGKAVDELRAAELVTRLRPISELRQEAYAQFGRRANSGPYRLVMLWRDSGYIGSRMEGRTGRCAAPDAKFAGQLIGVDGEPLTASGAEPTHFSEVPLEAFDHG